MYLLLLRLHEIVLLIHGVIFTRVNRVGYCLIIIIQG